MFKSLFCVKVLFCLSYPPSTKQRKFEWRPIHSHSNNHTCKKAYLFIFNQLDKMNRDEGKQRVCRATGCANIVDVNEEFCGEHKIVSNEATRTICVAPGCTNTAEFNDNLLCMPCYHTQKLTSRKGNGRFENKGHVSRPSKTTDCNINTNESCNQKRLRHSSPTPKLFTNARSISPEENTEQVSACKTTDCNTNTYESYNQERFSNSSLKLYRRNISPAENTGQVSKPYKTTDCNSNTNESYNQERFSNTSPKVHRKNISPEERTGHVSKSFMTSDCNSNTNESHNQERFSNSSPNIYRKNISPAESTGQVSKSYRTTDCNSNTNELCNQEGFSNSSPKLYRKNISSEESTGHISKSFMTTDCNSNTNESYNQETLSNSPKLCRENMSPAENTEQVSKLFMTTDCNSNTNESRNEERFSNTSPKLYRKNMSPEESTGYVSTSYETTDCNSNTTESCNQERFSNSSPKLHRKNITSEESTRHASKSYMATDNEPYNQEGFSNPLPKLFTNLRNSDHFNEANSNTSGIARNSTSIAMTDSIGNEEDECEYGNIVLTTNTRTGRRIVCKTPGCNREVPYNGAKCLEHECTGKQLERTICIMEGCDNLAELQDGSLCLVCTAGQRKAYEAHEATRAARPFNLVSCTTLKLNPFSSINLPPGNSAWQEQPNPSCIDMTALAQSLPPIPNPTCPSVSIQGETNLKEDDNSRFEVLARGMPDGACVEGGLSTLPYPFSNLPPVPMPFNRCVSNPGTSNPIVFTQISTDSISARTPSLPNTLTISSLVSSIPMVNDETIVSTSFPDEFVGISNTCVSPNQSSIEPSCPHTANEGYGGYCYRCLAFSIPYDSVRAPSASYYPRSIDLEDEDEYASPMASLRDEFVVVSDSSITARQICTEPHCRNVADEGFEGYCSQCFMNNVTDVPPSSSYVPPSSSYLGSIDFEEEYACARRIPATPCKGDHCEFFGSDELDGFCSGCYKEASIKKRLENDNDNDDKLCIICLSNEYNTVLLPCGHVYLCFECATAIKKDGKKCPACRGRIQSFHRIYIR